MARQLQHRSTAADSSIVRDRPNGQKNPRRRRKPRRKKNMATGWKIAIATGAVVVGIPLVLITVAAIGVAVVAKKGMSQLDDIGDLGSMAKPMDGTLSEHRWMIRYRADEPDQSKFEWWVSLPSGGVLQHSKAASYESARSEIANAVTFSTYQS